MEAAGQGVDRTGLSSHRGLWKTEAAGQGVDRTGLSSHRGLWKTEVAGCEITGGDPTTLRVKGQIHG